MSLPLTGSQTVGPFFTIGLNDLCSNQVPSVDANERLQIEGTLLDLDRLPIPDACLEIWCADTRGQYPQAGGDSLSPASALSPGFARVSTNADGHFSFSVVKPGNVPYDSQHLQAPHLVVLVFMRGLLRNLVTRMYFPDDPANIADPILQLIPESRRHTLIAQQTGSGSLEWTIVMRGEGETVFFAW